MSEKYHVAAINFEAGDHAMPQNPLEIDLALRAAKVAWDIAYSGMDESVYLHAFSIEARPFYPTDTGSEEHLRVEMNIPPGLLPPKGAAMVSARLALYAALVKAGEKEAVFDPSKLVQNNRQGRKFMQAYFRQRGVTVKFSEA